MSHESHGHSHRSGAATRYWREPKPIAITCIVFLILLLISIFSAPTSFSHTMAISHMNTRSLPKDIEYVVWHDIPLTPQQQQQQAFFRHLKEVDTSCEYRKRVNGTLYQNEIPLLRYVACTALECLWTVNLLLNRNHELHKNIQLIIHDDLRAHATAKSILDPNTQWKPLSTTWSEMFKSGNYVAAPLQFRLFPRSSSADSSNGDDPFSCKLVYTYPEYFPLTAQQQQPCGSLVHREDLKLCFKMEHQCSLLTAKACAPIIASLQQGESVQCGMDCWVWFQREVHSNEVMHHTMVLCLITLFLLGCVLGLLFAKLYWVDPLLDTNERLQLESKSRV